MEADKKDKIVKLAQIGTVAAYIFLLLHSTVGEYVKLARKNIRKEAKRREKLKKEKYKQKRRKLKNRQNKKKSSKRKRFFGR